MKISLLLTGSCRLLLLQILLGAVILEVKAELPMERSGRIEFALGGKHTFSLRRSEVPAFVNAWAAMDARVLHDGADWGRQLAWFDLPGFEYRGLADELAGGRTVAATVEILPQATGTFSFLQRQLRPPPALS